MIARIGIKEAKGLAPCGGIDYLVYLRQRVWILRAGLVQTHIVNAHPLLLALLPYKDRVRQPLGVWCLLDKTSCQQLFDFCANCFLPLVIKAA